MRIPRSQLNPAAVARANQKLWADHPELGGRQLTMDSADGHYREEWMQTYLSAVQSGSGLTRLPEASPVPPPRVVPEPTGPPVATMATSPVQQCPVASLTHEQKMIRAAEIADLGPAFWQAVGDPVELIATMVVVMGVLAAIAATGYGAIAEVIGLVLLAAGLGLSLKQIFDGIVKLVSFYNKTRCDRAQTEADLRAAARDFADGVANVGVGGLLAILSFFGGRRALRARRARLAVRRGLIDRAGQPRGPTRIRPEERGVLENGETLSGDPVRPPTLQEVSPGRPPALDPNKRYLYAVMEDGTVRIAEDVPFRASVNGQPVNVPRTGHPNVTGGQAARVAGELNYRNGRWAIDNNSGRYGSGTTLENVESAAELLRQSGMATPVEPMTFE